MISQSGEPTIKVGLLSAESLRLTLNGLYVTADGTELPSGDYTVSLEDSSVVLSTGTTRTRAPELVFAPLEPLQSRVTVNGVTIGVDFHWQRKESQVFQGGFKVIRSGSDLTLINALPLEDYLVSVISSEMSAGCPRELLRAHAIVSRSWLMAQLAGDREKAPALNGEQAGQNETPSEIIRWYDREGHSEFDVCADDHCQRYQGIGKAFARASFDAVQDTGGRILVYHYSDRSEICDARYSKCCGGMTEVYSTAWEEKDVPYLRSLYDGSDELIGYPLPLSSNCNAGRFITSRPPAYCNTESAELLSMILPAFDQETRNFFRWEVAYPAHELTEIVSSRLGLDIGRIRALAPLERGPSGRILRLEIKGENRSIVIGKELEIRRALSRSHLYSSAFVVRVMHSQIDGQAEEFRLIGAGWGHGVGLCQIGAAVMAERGHTNEEILQHYFRGAVTELAY